MRIEEEIQQKVFINEYQKSHINILYTAGWLELGLTQVLKPYNISPQQFNILRILRGSHPALVGITELTARMLDKSPNTSRLVDKLIAKNYCHKMICADDNRRMNVGITETGLSMLQLASSDMEAFMYHHFSAITLEEAATLNLILDKLRG